MSVDSPRRVHETADRHGQRPCLPSYQHVHLITGLRSLASTGVKPLTIPPAIPRERLRRTARTHRPGRDSHQMLTFGDRHPRSILLSTRPTTTEGTPVAAASSGRRSPTTPSPALPRSRSGAGSSSAGSSTNTSRLGRSPGQRLWPNSGTPQALGGRHRHRLGPDHCPATSTLTSRKPSQRPRKEQPGACGTPGHPARQPGHRHTQTLKSGTVQRLSRRPGPAIRPRE